MSTNVPCPRTHTYTYTASILSVSILKVTFVSVIWKPLLALLALLLALHACTKISFVVYLFVSLPSFVRRYEGIIPSYQVRYLRKTY